MSEQFGKCLSYVMVGWLLIGWPQIECVLIGWLSSADKLLILIFNTKIKEVERENSDEAKYFTNNQFNKCSDETFD